VTIIDTNVLSETLKPAPSQTVLRWLRAQEPSSVFMTVITQAELLSGVELLPDGKRRMRLQEAVRQILTQQFSGRILAFDEAAAREYATIVASRRAVGRPISEFDASIAAIARSHGAAVATRDTADFDRCGIKLINPWLDEP